jgi:LacI family transcriptional regulator
MKRAVTQKDIAQRLGVSQALVSRVLTGTSKKIGVSPATAEKILQAAAACHYRPSAAALTLKGGPTRTLGVVVKNFDDPFLGHLIGALQRLAMRDGYALLLSGWNASQGEAADLVLLRQFRPDGLILCGSDFTPGAVRLFLAEGRPVVQVCTGDVLTGVQQVAFDQRAGLEALVRMLVGLGHSRFGYVGDASAPNRRRAAIMRELLQRNRRLPVEFVEVTQGADGPVMDSVKALCGDPVRRPTAMIVADDALAQSVLRAMHECGVRVPQDMSLAGMDDIPMARMMIPALTTIRQPVEAMAESAFQAVTAAKRGGGRVKLVVVAPELMVRESCAPPSLAHHWQEHEQGKDGKGRYE